MKSCGSEIFNIYLTVENPGIALFNTLSGTGLAAVWVNIMAGAFVVIALIAYGIRQQMIKNED